mgnify:FL=1
MGSRTQERNDNLMKTITIPDTDLTLSPLGLGCVKAGLKWDGGEADRLFDAFLYMGGNVYDTARVYSDWISSERGRSERVIGDWLSRSGKRQDVILMTKGGHPDMTVASPDLHNTRISASNMRADLELSLRALHTDYIDLYFYHRDNTDMEAGELVEIMEEFRREGKIRYYGCSNWSTERINEADTYAASKGYRGFAANQALFNLGCAHMNPPSDDTLAVMDESMQQYHKENPSNLAMPYMANCGGFFHKLYEGGRDAVKDSEYCTPGNLKVAEHLHQLMEEYQVTITQAVLGYLTCQEFTCLPLYGPRNIPDLKDAMETFVIPFRREDYSA